MRRYGKGAAWVLGVTILLAGALPIQAQTTPTVEELLRVVQEQSRQIAEQNRLIQDLAGRVQALEAKQSAAGAQAAVAGSPSAEIAALKEDVAALSKKVDKRLVLAKHVEGLKVTGDLRLRYEYRNRQREINNPDNDDRDRIMTRLRLGLVWNVPSEGWEFGAGLITGASDGRSGNDVWGEDHLFETGDIRLDYAYARHTWMLGERPVALTLGQQRNPLVVTPLMWDADLRPTGATVQYGDPFKKDYCGPFATAGLYEFYNGSVMGTPSSNENGDVFLAAAQAGYHFTGTPAEYLVALGWHHVTSNVDDTVTPADTSSPGLWHADQEGEFDVVDLLAESRLTAGPVEFRPYGQAAWNLGADGPKSQQTLVRGYNAATNPEDPEDHALAWIVGLDTAYGRLKLGYAYLYVGADAVFGPLRDNETGATTGVTDTDVKGHKLTATWSFTPNLTVSANANIMKRIEGGSGNVGGSEYDKGATYQLEAIYKF